MSQIIYYLHVYNQYLLNQTYKLTLFITKYIPLKQWAFDDSKSPSYKKLKKIDKLPIIKKFFKQDYRFLLEYYLWKYNKLVKPVQRCNGKTISKKNVCPLHALVATVGKPDSIVLACGQGCVPQF